MIIILYYFKYLKISLVLYLMFCESFSPLSVKFVCHMASLPCLHKAIKLISASLGINYLISALLYQGYFCTCLWWFSMPLMTDLSHPTTQSCNHFYMCCSLNWLYYAILQQKIIKLTRAWTNDSNLRSSLWAPLGCNLTKCSS